MYRRANTVFLQLCFVVFFCPSSSAAVIEKYGAMSAGEIQPFDFKKCFELGGHLRYDEMQNNSSRRMIRCEIAHNYYCLQTQVVSSPEELAALNQLGCVELHADLIVNRFRSNSSNELQSMLSRIRKIKGRLIINENYLPGALSFDELEEVGHLMFMGQSPTIQITQNRATAIRFPKLHKIDCLKNTRRTCVVIGGNLEVAASSSTLISMKKETFDAFGHFHTELLTEEPDETREEPEEAEWTTMDLFEKESKTHPSGYEIEDIQADFFVARRYVYGIVALAFFFGAAGVILSAVFKKKRKELRLLSSKYEYKDNW